MSWLIDDHPEGGLRITHQAFPRFSARWTTGTFPLDQVREGAFFWTDEGGGADDAIHLYDFIWCDPPPAHGRVERIVRESIKAIERHIVSRT
ncbi:MAG: hypothetical protein KC435_09270 [Thermomicrobiales bacterium]|nr:hypothetical protein [Thermomicrobiales bacterium]